MSEKLAVHQNEHVPKIGRHSPSETPTIPLTASLHQKQNKSFHKKNSVKNITRERFR